MAVNLLLYISMCSVSYVRSTYWREKQESNLQGLRSTVFKTGAVVTSASSPQIGGRKRSRTSTACAARFPRGCRRPSAGPSRLVEAVGFEPTTARSQSESSAWLSYTSKRATCNMQTCNIWRKEEESNLYGLRPTVFETATVTHRLVLPVVAEDERIARPRRSRDGRPLAVVPITSLAIPHKDPGRIRTCVRWVAATCLAARPRDQMCGWTHRD